ncbi:EAL domain-containing protein [Marinomonas dokdonensis]|uniref:EAL domain-containing protein n=1 Tax=Marinomonas dokdonensis TaxID=328224 RepID=UPI0040555C7D
MLIASYDKNKISFSLLKKHLANTNFVMLFSVLLLSLVLVFSLSHFFIIQRERESLQSYVEEIFSRAKQTSRQIYQTIGLIDALGESSCDAPYLSSLQEILSHHYLIEDAGRIVGDKIMCAAKIGVFEPPKVIQYEVSTMSAIRDIRVLMTKSGVFYSGERRAILNYKNFFITLVPTVYLGVESPDEHSGAVFKNYETGEVIRVFHNIDRQMAASFYERQQNYPDFLLLPDQSIRVELCSETYRYCIDGIDFKLGIFDIAFSKVLYLVFLSFILAYAIYISIHYIKNIKGSLKYRLSYAIQNNKIYPLYQPKINLKTGKIVGVEALARWQDEVLGAVSPDTFIALAEDLKLIKTLTKQITRAVLQDAKEILARNEDFTVSLNLSVQDLVDAGFLRFIEDEVEKQGIRRQQIILEIAERCATESESLSSSAHDFYIKGYQISLDDFGTGFCNLSWLSKLESDEIKIDRMFTHSIGSNSVGLITLDGICQLLSNFHMKVVFEGIETQQEVDYIMAKSPDAIGQGWLFAKAMPMADIKLLLESK